jgi:hypothetical protein
MHMSRTIAVKISEKEEQIITHLNRQGISNSEILRTALHHYFELLHQPIPEDKPEKDILSLMELKDEMQLLQEQTRRSQEQLEHEIGKLHRQLYQLTADPNVVPRVSLLGKRERIGDIHREVDEFLRTITQQVKMGRK